MSGSLAIPNGPIGRNDVLIEAYGFVPNLFRGQRDLPRVVEAEQLLIHSILLQERALKRPTKERLLRIVAGVQHNAYCHALHRAASLEDTQDTPALSAFAVKLAQYGPWTSKRDIEALLAGGLGECAILEAVLAIALGQFLCTVAKALRPEIDPELRLPDFDERARDESFTLSEPQEYVATPGPYLKRLPGPGPDFRPYSVLREQFGFVPNLYQEQLLRSDVVGTEVQALEQILIAEDELSRIQKENIVLVVSAANANTYCVAVHTQILAALGVPEEKSDQIVDDCRQAPLSPADVALLEESRKLACQAQGNGGDFAPERLRDHGFTGAQVTEAVAMAAWTNFLNAVQLGVGAVPDFPPRRIFTPKDLYRFVTIPRPISEASFPADPDAAFVSRVQSGDREAFEELVRRHTRRIFGTVAGIVGDLDDARDATQDVFLKAFEHIDRFEGKSKFSTWLTSIAVNTATELLRRRKPSESLDDVEEGENFRPRMVQNWAENPEQLLSASQRKELVREAVLRLPQKYRVAVLLRDISQISTEEAAAALGLSVPALKARVLRGRLMLRESLAPHFVRAEEPDA